MFVGYKKPSYFCDICGELTRVVENPKEGEISCAECGLVLSEHLIDQTSEWRTFANDDSETTRSRVGAPVDTFLSGNGLSTMMGAKDFKGNTVNPMDPGAVRLQNETALSSEDRALSAARVDIGNICTRLGVNEKEVIDISCTIYKEILRRKLLRGRNSEAVKVVCVYISCRMEDRNISIKEICEIMHFEKKIISKTFIFIRDKMDMKLKSLKNQRFVERYCAILGMPSEDIQAVEIVVETIERDELLVQGKQPMTIVAVAIYFISFLSGRKLEHKQISDTCKIKEATIRHTYNELYPSLPTLVPTNWKAKVDMSELPVPPAYRK